jgi:hypothetical protein
MQTVRLALCVPFEGSSKNVAMAKKRRPSNFENSANGLSDSAVPDESDDDDEEESLGSISRRSQSKSKSQTALGKKLIAKKKASEERQRRSSSSRGLEMTVRGQKAAAAQAAQRAVQEDALRSTSSTRPAHGVKRPRLVQVLQSPASSDTHLSSGSELGSPAPLARRRGRRPNSSGDQPPSKKKLKMSRGSPHKHVLSKDAVDRAVAVTQEKGLSQAAKLRKAISKYQVRHKEGHSVIFNGQYRAYRMCLTFKNISYP